MFLGVMCFSIGPTEGKQLDCMFFMIFIPSRRNTVFRQNKMRQLNVEFAVRSVIAHVQNILLNLRLESVVVINVKKECIISGLEQMR